MPEAKTVKNRLHIDVPSGPGEREQTMHRLQALGATAAQHTNRAAR
ncbi:VOC family protein [Streptomyces sparsus]